MNNKAINEPTVEDVMTHWSKCGSIKDTAQHFDKTYKSVEIMVARYKHNYERSFNFPHIIHAKRFGA